MREGAKLMTASHRKQSKVSKSGLSCLDLLANIATPQIGQCFMDRDRVAIASPWLATNLLIEAARLQLRPKQYDREEDERNADGSRADDGLYGHCLAPSLEREKLWRNSRRTL
jgi:hypothetical protein